MNFSSIPLQNIVAFGQQTMLDRPLFNISWILGRFCNYKCSYCWPYARSDVPDHQSLDVYKSTVDEIKRQSRANGFDQFHWSFSGGEQSVENLAFKLLRARGQIDKLRKYITKLDSAELSLEDQYED